MTTPKFRKLEVNFAFASFYALTDLNFFLLSGLLHANESLLEVLQGQEDRDTSANQFGAFKPPPVPHLTSPPNPDWNRSPIGRDNQLQFWMRGPIYPCPSNTVSFPGGNIARLGIPNSRHSTFNSYGVHDNAVGSRSLSVPNVSHNSGSQKWRGSELKHANEVPLAAPHRYMLFGVNLVSNSPELPSSQVATSVVNESHNYVPVTSQSSVSEPSKSTSGVNSEKQCKNCCSAAIRSCTKVNCCLFFIFLCVLGSRLLSCTFRGASHIKASASKTFFL